MFSAEDAGGLVQDLLRLLRARAVEEAAQRIQQANIAAARASYVKRAEGVAEISRTIHTLALAREQMERGIEALPEDVQFHARHELQPMLWALFDREISRLRRRKRSLSLPDA